MGYSVSGFHMRLEGHGGEGIPRWGTHFPQAHVNSDSPAFTPQLGVGVGWEWRRTEWKVNKKVAGTRRGAFPKAHKPLPGWESLATHLFLICKSEEVEINLSKLLMFYKYVSWFPFPF